MGSLRNGDGGRTLQQLLLTRDGMNEEMPRGHTSSPNIFIYLIFVTEKVKESDQRSAENYDKQGIPGVDE